MRMSSALPCYMSSVGSSVLVRINFGGGAGDTRQRPCQTPAAAARTPITASGAWLCRRSRGRAAHCRRASTSTLIWSDAVTH